MNTLCCNGVHYDIMVYHIGEEANNKLKQNKQQFHMPDENKYLKIHLHRLRTIENFDWIVMPISHIEVSNLHELHMKWSLLNINTRVPYRNQRKTCKTIRHSWQIKVSRLYKS